MLFGEEQQAPGPAPGWTSLGGDCPLLRDQLAKRSGAAWSVCSFAVALLRGFSQCSFSNNPITGIILISALAIVAPYRLAACAATGFLGHLISILIREPSVNIDNGLTIFNPLVFGAVSHYFVPVVYGGFDGFSTLMMILCTIFIAYLWRACGKGGTPCLTMPFNLAELILLFTLKNARAPILSSPFENATFSNVDNESTLESAIQLAVDNATFPPDSLDWGVIVRASVTSASQLFVVDSVPLGAIVYLAVLIYSPITCLFGFLGSLGGSLVGLAVGAAHKDVAMGLWGFNGYLTGASLGGSFLVLNGQVAAATCVAIVHAGFMQHVLQLIFAPTGLPVGTIPFVLTVWLFIGLGATPEGAFFYPLTMSCPEEQRRDFYSRRRTAKLEQVVGGGEPEVLLRNGKASLS